MGMWVYECILWYDYDKTRTAEQSQDKDLSVYGDFHFKDETVVTVLLL